MTGEQSESRLWMAVGGMAAMGCGVALVPFRSLTPASNLAFVFLILTIVIAEIGGRGAGLVTAVVSALSLNFFLTEPYLALTIDKPDDVVAFVALAAAGLVAAAFGRRRARSSAVASAARHDLDALERAAEKLAGGAPLEEVLHAIRRGFDLGGLVVRRADGQPVAAVPTSHLALPEPVTPLDPRTLLGTDLQPRFGRRGLRLPEGGGRLPIGSRTDRLWLDMWEGDPEGLTTDDCRALAVAVAILGLGARREAAGSLGPGRGPTS